MNHQPLQIPFNPFFPAPTCIPKKIAYTYILQYTALKIAISFGNSGRILARLNEANIVQRQ